MCRGMRDIVSNRVIPPLDRNRTRINIQYIHTHRHARGKPYGTFRNNVTFRKKTHYGNAGNIKEFFIRVLNGYYIILYTR